MADAVCGSIFNAIRGTRFDSNEEIKIHTYESMSYDDDFSKDNQDVSSVNMIRAPRMPEQLKDAMDRMMVI